MHNRHLVFADEMLLMRRVTYAVCGTVLAVCTSPWLIETSWLSVNTQNETKSARSFWGGKADDPAGACSSPQIAVCISGQLRNAVASRVMERMHRKWEDIGAGCVDIYLFAAVDGIDHTHFAYSGHGCTMERSHEQALRLLKPVAWKLWDGANVLASDTLLPSTNESSPGLTRFDVTKRSSAAEEQCRRPADFGADSVLCGRNMSTFDCGKEHCTHCHYPSLFVTPIYRHKLCMNEVMQHERARGHRYSYFAFQRPDVSFGGTLPPFANWSSLFPPPTPSATSAGAALFADDASRDAPMSALFCSAWSGCQRQAGCVSDSMAIMPRRVLSLMHPAMLNAFATCQSRRANVRAGTSGNRFFVPEEAMYAAFASSGVQLIHSKEIGRCWLDRRCKV